MKNSRLVAPEKKIKVTMWIQQKTKKLIAKHCKYAGISYGQLADLTFQQKLQDPVGLVEEEIQEKVEQLRVLQERRDELIEKLGENKEANK
jgi:hypothetical protein